MALFYRWGFLQAPVLQHRLRVGWRTAPCLVHVSEVLGVTARDDHLAEAVAVSTRQAAMFNEPLEGIVGEHLGPEIGIVAGAVAVTSPDVGEVGRAIAWWYVADIEVSLIERLLLELIGFLERSGGRKRVPLYVEFGRGQEFRHVIALVESFRFLDFGYEIFRHRRTGFVVLRIVGKNQGIAGPMLVELRGKFDEVTSS